MKHVHNHLESGILFTPAELQADLCRQRERDMAVIDAAYRLYIVGQVNIDGTYGYPYDAIIEAADQEEHYIWNLGAPPSDDPPLPDLQDWAASWIHEHRATAQCDYCTPDIICPNCIDNEGEKES